MTDQAKLSEFWEKSVPERYKHYSDTEFVDKAAEYGDKLRKHLISNIDFRDVHTVLDWGCGGGYGSSLLSENADVVAVDISKTSLKKCGFFLEEKGIRLKNAYLLQDLEELIINEKIDVVFSASVIQHFPSIDYWKKVVSKWISLKPGWVAIQSRHGNENKDNESIYYDDLRNYILGLYLTTDEVISSFSEEYELVYHFLDDDGYSMYEYFVFRLRG